MQIKPAIGSVVGQSDPNHWGQVLIAPSAYGVVEIETSDGIARTIGIGLLGKLSDRLNEPVVSLEEIKAIVDEIIDSSVVSLVLLIPVGMVLYLVVGGSGTVYLKRGDQFACLLEGPGAISGQIQEGDSIIAATRSFTSALTQDDILTAFDHLPANDVAEKLTLVLHESSAGPGGAGLVFQASQAIPIEEVVVQPTVKSRKWFFLRHRLTFLEGVNKKVLLVAALSIFLFTFSVILGIARRTGTASQETVKTALVEAQHAFDEGVALLDLNPVKGRERISQAKMILEPLTATVSAKTKEGRQLKALLKEISDRLSMAMQIVKEEPQLFYDVAFLKKDSRVSSMAIRDDQLALLDAAGKTVYVVGLATKNGQVVGGGLSFTDAKLVSLHGDKVYVWVAAGVHMIRMSDKKTEPLVIKKDDEWGIISSMVSFGGNIYLLDTAKSRVWKYVATEKAAPAGGQGFSERREYLNPDTLPDLSKATGMAIDGSVWIGTNNGATLRFTQGKENTFITQGVEPAFGSNLSVYTSDQIKHIYVLDHQNKRVVILDSDGAYLSQYVWEGNFQPMQFVVSETQKKILFLADGKIYALELK